MSASTLWAWDTDNDKWVKIKTDSQGRLYIVAVIDELDDIGDVNVPAPTDMQGIEWDTTTSKWILTNYMLSKLLTARGDIITRSATVPKRLAKGTTGHFLEAGANEPQWAAHKALTTGIHGVGANYICYTKGAVKEALFHNDHMARAYLSANQNNIADDSAVLVNLNAESFDPGNNFDIANHKYVTPVAGYYLVSFAVRFEDTIADKLYTALVYLDATKMMEVMAHSSSTADIALATADLLHAAAGQDIKLYVWNITGGATTDIKGEVSGTYLSISLVQAD